MGHSCLTGDSSTEPSLLWGSWPAYLVDYNKMFMIWKGLSFVQMSFLNSRPMHPTAFRTSPRRWLKGILNLTCPKLPQSCPSLSQLRAIQFFSCTGQSPWCHPSLISWSLTPYPALGNTFACIFKIYPGSNHLPPPHGYNTAPSCHHSPGTLPVSCRSYGCCHSSCSVYSASLLKRILLIVCQISSLLCSESATDHLPPSHINQSKSKPRPTLGPQVLHASPGLCFISLLLSYTGLLLVP